MIDHKSATPLYNQLAQALSDGIRSGKYLPGDKLPSENALCREYDVSRITVRQAMNLLAQQNLVVAMHGKGTFVKAPTINQELGKIVSFRHALQQKGLDGRTYVLDFREDEEARLELLGCAAQSPAVYYCSRFPKALGEPMYRAALEAQGRGEAFSTFDLYSLIGVPLSRVEQTIGAINATAELEQTLKVPHGQALIVLESQYYGEDGRLLEHKTGYYRSDFYAFHLHREI